MDASSSTATLTVTGWSPDRYQTQDPLYGFDLQDDAVQQFGVRPTGFPAGVKAMYADSDHVIWLVADAGVFAHQGIAITIGSQTWNLQYDETVSGIDQFFSRAASAAPWTSNSVSFTIHALGGKTPFTSAAKQWSLVDPIPTPVARWAVAGQPEPDRRPAGVAALPARFSVGQRIVLLNAANYQPYYTIHPDAIEFGVIGVPDIGGTGWALRRYSGSISDMNLRNRLVLRKPASAPTPTHITIDGTRYACAPISVTSQNDFFVDRSYSLTLFDRNHAHNVWWETASANYPAQVAYPPGDYTADTETSLVITPGSTAVWAQAGSADKIPASKISGALTIHLLKLTYASGAWTQAWQPQRHGCSIAVNTSNPATHSIVFTVPSGTDPAVIGVRIINRNDSAQIVGSAFIPRGAADNFQLPNFSIAAAVNRQPPNMTYTISYTIANGGSLEYALVAI